MKERAAKILMIMIIMVLTPWLNIEVVFTKVLKSDY
jgi:hypothetical protein